MLKDIFSSFFKGFFYTIGKILVYFFIGFIIYTLITKFPVDQTDLFPLMRGGIL